MSFVQIERQGGVTVLALNRGVANPLNLALVQELLWAVLNVENDPDVGALVLTSSSEKFFSIGFDLPELIPLKRDDFAVFYRAFNELCVKIFALPKPTVAAITGHAVAGGCILVLCCDYRFIARGRKLMGVNEVKLGVPVPYPGDRILRSLTGPQNSREILLRGEFYGPEESLDMGIVDRVLPLEEVVPAAVESARSLGALPAQAFQAVKRSRVEPVLAEIEARMAEKEEVFMKQWYSREARELLEKAMKKF